MTLTTTTINLNINQSISRAVKWLLDLNAFSPFPLSPLALPTIPCCSSLDNAHDSALLSPPVVSQQHFVSFRFARVYPPPCL